MNDDKNTSHSIPILEQVPTNVLVLKKAIQSWDSRNCQHTHIIVDPILSQVKCEKCEKLLDPMAVLVRFTDEQSLWQFRATQYRDAYIKFQALDQELATKHRCKCEHCKKMTRIDRRVSELKVVK